MRKTTRRNDLLRDRTALSIVKLVRVIAQVCCLWSIAWVGRYIVHVTHLPLPGNLLGMGLLYLLFTSGICKVDWIEEGANWLLSLLLLFFVPSVVSVMGYRDVLFENWLPISLILVVGTMCVMAVTLILGESISYSSRKNNEL